ncbi:MAG: hypothetical protein ACKOD2_13930 [Ilumatobacteraceae bacterium]
MNPVVLVGGDAIAAGWVPTLRTIAVEMRVGMLNTFAAKGLFEWNDPAHLGTIGLQALDLELAGVAGADVVLVGVPDHEIPASWLDAVGARCTHLDAHQLRAALTPNAEPTPRPPLYGALAAVCGPMYAIDSVPINPARAAADLAGWLPADGAVQAWPDTAGFWLARTFPTRVLGSMRVAPRGVDQTSTVYVVAEHEPANLPAGAVVERWSADGPQLAPHERLVRLAQAVDSGAGAVLDLGVNLDAVATLEAVAGPPRWP